MKIAVTGADGFVGKHLCALLRERGDRPVELIGPRRDGVGGPAAAVGTMVDVTDAAAVAAALSDASVEAVIHLAGFSSVGKSHEMPGVVFQVNAVGTVNVLRAARGKRVVVIGSGEMYGAVAPGTRAAEEHPLRPLSPYAASKVAAEVAAIQFHRSYGADVVCARPFNHLGVGQDPAFVVPAFAAQISEIRRGRAEPLVRVGNLEPVRDFSHVRDVVEAYRLLVEKGRPGEVYNVCSGEGRSIRALLDEMIAIAGVTAKVEVDPARVRPVDLPSLVGNPAKLLALGWAPRHTWKDALAEVLQAAG
ncbi:MAG TPA: GDP-mannose 4,6-dehydratase [Myxococcaceae bacterium]